VIELEGDLKGLVAKTLILGRNGVTLEMCEEEQRSILDIRRDNLLEDAVRHAGIMGSGVLDLGVHWVSTTPDGSLCCLGFEAGVNPEQCAYCQCFRADHLARSQRRVIAIFDVCVGPLDLCSLLWNSHQFFWNAFGVCSRDQPMHDYEVSSVCDRVYEFIFKIGMKLLLAIGGFWDRGYAHCDVKPENVCVDRPEETEMEDVAPLRLDVIDFASRLPLDSRMWPESRDGQRFHLTEEYSCLSDVLSREHPIDARTVDVHSVMVIVRKFLLAYNEQYHALEGLTSHQSLLNGCCRGDLCWNDVDVQSKLTFLVSDVNQPASKRPSALMCVSMAYCHANMCSHIRSTASASKHA
jgi:hypothetical protein